MLTHSQDTHTVLQHLQGQLQQLRADLEQDMDGFFIGDFSWIT